MADCRSKGQKQPDGAGENYASPNDWRHNRRLIVWFARIAFNRTATGTIAGDATLRHGRNPQHSVHNNASQRSESGRRSEKVMVEDLHRQRVLNLLDAFYAGDIETALSHCSDDVDFFSNAPVDILPHLGHRRGKDEVRQMWTSIHSRYSSMRYQVPIVVAEGDKVAVHIRVFFVKRKNDRIMQFDIAVFYTFAGGRIVRIREIMDTFDLIQQLLERDLVALLTDDPAGRI
jgi:ketosteroid isomerase-like protein